jgi:hypothetical protein
MLHCPGASEDCEEAGPEDVEDGAGLRDLRLEAEGGGVLRHGIMRGV